MANLTSVRVVPLPDFFVYPHGIKDEKLHSTKLAKNLLKLIFLPRGYVISHESDHSPFLKVIREKRNELMYDNPSLEACIKFKFSSARSYYIRHLVQYFCFALIISLPLGLVSSPTTSDTVPINSETDLLNYIYSQMVIGTFFFLLSSYFTYYLLAAEVRQAKQNKIKRYLNIYNFMDITSILLPFFTLFVSYAINMIIYLSSINYTNTNNNFQGWANFISKNYDLSKISKAIIITSSFVVLILWLEFVSLLFIYFFFYFYTMINNNRIFF